MLLVSLNSVHYWLDVVLSNYLSFSRITPIIALQFLRQLLDHLFQGFMDFTMNAKEDTISNYGRFSRTALTAYLSVIRIFVVICVCFLNHFLGHSTEVGL